MRLLRGGGGVMVAVDGTERVEIVMACMVVQLGKVMMISLTVVMEIVVFGWWGSDNGDSGAGCDKCSLWVNVMV